MTITSYPFDNQDTTEAQYSELMREMADSGVADSSDGTGLKFTANGTGMSGTVQPGFAVVRGVGFKSTAVEPVTFLPSTAGVARIDAVILRLDPNLNTIVIAVVKGTNGVTTPPPLIRTVSGIYEMLIGLATIRAGAPTVLATDALDRRDLQGSTVGSWVTDQRPLNPRKRKLGFNETTGFWENWDGTAWSNMVALPAAHVHNPEIFGFEVGAAHDGVAPLIHRFGTTVATVVAGGGLQFPWGAVPNGLLWHNVTPADNGCDQLVSILANMQGKTSWNGYAKLNGTVLPVGSAVRCNWEMWAW